jgi:hypothetical protein
MNSSISSASRNSSLSIILIGIAMAIVFGLVSVTANPILVSVSVSLVMGTVLLTRPAWIVWLILTLGLLVTGILPLFTDDGLVTKTAWGVSLLGLILAIVAFFMVITSPVVRKETPVFVWVAVSFFFYTVLVSFVQWYSMGEFTGGFKRYFHMWGLLFAFCWLAFDKTLIRRLRKFILIVALVQLPFALYQLIVLVPIREGLRNAMPGLGLVPIDVVAGTFGATLYGGGLSGEMAVFLIIILAFLLAQRMEKTITLRRLLLLAPLVMAPLFLGETKAVIILLPLMFLVLYRRAMIARPHYGVAGLLLGALLTAAAGYAYLSLSDRSLHDQIDDSLGYNVYNKGYGFYHLNRTTVLTFWAEQQGAHNPVSFLFGNGLGSSHSSAGGHVAMRYPNHGIGLTAASTLLWDTGIFGSGLFAAILALAWRTAGRLQKRSPEPIVRADAAAIQAALAIFAVYLFFRQSLLETMSYQIVFVVMLGYLAWLHRMHVRSAAKSHL